MSSEPDNEDVEMINREKKKLVMDFGLGQARPDRVTVEVLKVLIVQKPETMGRVAKRWLERDRELLFHPRARNGPRTRRPRKSTSFD